MATRQHSQEKSQKVEAGFRVIATNSAYEKLCRQSLKKLPARFRSRFQLHSFSSLEGIPFPDRQVARTIYVSRLADLPAEGSKKSLPASAESKHLLFLSGLPIEAMPPRLLQLDIRNPHRLHLAAEREQSLIVDLVYRLLGGMAHADGPQSIVDAWVENERLVLLSPGFDRLAVPLKLLAPMIGTDTTRIEAFEIDEDGRFLFWPHADVHLGWEQLLQLVDPAAAVSARQKTEGFNKRYGMAIRTFREEAGLTQSDIAGVTERHLRRVEHGDQAATTGILEALSVAHGMSLDDYLERLAKAL